MGKWTVDQIKTWIKDHPSFAISSKEELVSLSENIVETFSVLDSPSKLMLTESIAEACVKFDYDDKEIVKLLQGELDMNKDEVKIAVKEVLTEGEGVEVAALKTELASKDTVIAQKDTEINTLKTSLTEKDTLITAAQNTITQLEADKTAAIAEKDTVNTELANINKEQPLNDRKVQLMESSLEFDKLTDDQKKLVETADDSVFSTMLSLIPKKEVKEKKKDLVDASLKNRLIKDDNDTTETKDYSFVRKGSRVLPRV